MTDQVGPLADCDADDDPASQIRRLENIVFAQRWDIDGLTTQRDESYAQLTAQEAEMSALRAEIDRLQSQLGLRNLEMQRAVQSLAGRSAAAMALHHATVKVGGELHMAEPGSLLPSHLLGEALLIQASGLFDLAFYLRQISQVFGLTEAICHYVREGEASGLLANALFHPGFYAHQAARAALGGAERFRTRLAHYAAVGASHAIRPGPLVDYAYCMAQAPAREREQFEPITAWLQVGRRAGTSTHPLIDLEHYRRHRGVLRPTDDALADYLLVGASMRLSLCALFDPAWYLESYEDVRNAGLDPFLHYVGFGDAEGRQPNPLFDPAYYRAQQTEKLPAETSALGHYVLEGRAQGARTHPLFDSGWYLARNEDVRATGVDPLRHYLESGAIERRSPHPLVDVKYLLACFPGLLGQHANPLVAFQRAPERLTGSAHPLFDPATYVAQVPEAADHAGGIFAHFVAFGADNLADPHPLFCTRYYLEQVDQPVVRQTALAHYLSGGGRRGFRPFPLFDPWFYFRNNPDVVSSGSDPLVHFVLSGGTRREHRQPHPLFDISYYAAAVRETVDDNANLLLDFVLNWRDRPSPHPLFDPLHYAAQARNMADRDDDAEQTAPVIRHANPLADYVWHGIEARRSPHPLFDIAHYLRHVDVAPDWTRTLLEHYCTRQAPELFLPHPAMDGPLVAAQIGHVAESNATLLEHYVANAVAQDLDPHPLFSGRCRILRAEPDEIAARDPLTRFLALGNNPDWLDQPVAALKAALCGTGGIAAINPMLARAGAHRSRLPERRPRPENHLLTGSLPPGCTRLALYAGHATEGALGLHRHMIAALREAGFAVLFIDGALQAPSPPAPLLAAAADLVLSHDLGGQQIGSWMLACRLLADQIAACDQVLFVTDNLVGPLGPMDAVWRSLDASRGGWWGIIAADQSGASMGAEFFALSGAIIRSTAFREFVAHYRFIDSWDRVIEPLEQALSRALLDGGFTPEFMHPMEALRTTWLAELPGRLNWSRDLAQWAALFDGDNELASRVASFAQGWLRDITQQSTNGLRLRPGLLFWDTLMRHGVPLIRRDLLAVNLIKTPDLLRLPALIGPDAFAILADLLFPTLPDYPADLQPLLRVTRELLRLPADAVA